MADRNTVEAIVRKVRPGKDQKEKDILAVEEPLEIRLAYDRNGVPVQRSISVTMRTPGNDSELAVGFLYTENIISSREEIKDVSQAFSKKGGFSEENVVCVQLVPGKKIDLGGLERHFYTTSSCGVCGKASLEALKLTYRFPIIPAQPVFQSRIVNSLPDILHSTQSVFESTGGLHAAGLFDQEGNQQVIREDVGRHNAVDKVIGHELLSGRIPLSNLCLLVSGRTSFEILQKALAAGIPLVAGIGAPSSLAVEVANSFKMTLLGFVRDNRFNIYSSPERIVAK